MLTLTLTLDNQLFGRYLAFLVHFIPVNSCKCRNSLNWIIIAQVVTQWLQ